jgi:hypothetical protein
MGVRRSIKCMIEACKSCMQCCCDVAPAPKGIEHWEDTEHLVVYPGQAC